MWITNTFVMEYATADLADTHLIYGVVVDFADQLFKDIYFKIDATTVSMQQTVLNESNESWYVDLYLPLLSTYIRNR